MMGDEELKIIATAAVGAVTRWPADFFYEALCAPPKSSR